MRSAFLTRLMSWGIRSRFSHVEKERRQPACRYLRCAQYGPRGCHCSRCIRLFSCTKALQPLPVRQMRRRLRMPASSRVDLAIFSPSVLLLVGTRGEIAGCRLCKISLPSPMHKLDIPSRFSTALHRQNPFSTSIPPGFFRKIGLPLPGVNQLVDIANTQVCDVRLGEKHA